MSLEENKTLARRFFEVFSEEDLTTLAQLVAHDFVDHVPIPEQQPGLEGLQYKATMSRAAFPDMRFTIVEQTAEGDRVVTQSTMHATHLTGKAVTIAGTSTMRIAGGKIVEYWAETDLEDLARQLGSVQ